MRIILVGCGRWGAGLAHHLNHRGDAVTVVDENPVAFERLGASFKGQKVIGIGFDRDVLREAGIEYADGLAAVTASDETNVVTARLAREVFRVPRVVARLYDPRKAEIYRKLGVQTISTTAWGIQRIAELLCYSEIDVSLSLGRGEVEIAEAEIPSLLAGRPLTELALAGELQVVAITRGGHTFLPASGMTFQMGDRVHLVMLATSAERVKSLLTLK